MRACTPGLHHWDEAGTCLVCGAQRCASTTADRVVRCALATIGRTGYCGYHQEPRAEEPR